MSIHDTRPKNAIMGSYIYTFTTKSETLVQESYNLVSAVGRLGLVLLDYNKHGIHYLQSTPFEERKTTIWVGKPGICGTIMYTVTQKWNTYDTCTCCHVHLAPKGEKICKSCKPILERNVAKIKKDLQMTEYEECTEGKSLEALIKDFKYQIDDLGYSPTDSYPSFLRDLINKKLAKYGKNDNRD